MYPKLELLSGIKFISKLNFYLIKYDKILDMHIKLDLNYLIIKLVLIIYSCVCYILRIEVLN